MASSWYDKAKEKLMSGDLDLLDGTIKAVLVKSGYTQSQSHAALSDIPGAQRVTGGTSGALANKSVTNGTFDADDVVFSAPTNGEVAAAVVVYLDSGTEATSWLVAYEDGPGFPATMNGQPFTVRWDNDADRIARL